MNACQDAELPPPQFTERSGGILVELNHQPVETNKISEPFRKDFGMISERIRNDFGAEIAKAYEVICRNPRATAQQIADEIGKTPRTVENYLSKLKDAGFIIRKGPKLGGYWEIVEFR